MIDFIYRGAGAGRYAGYVSEGVKRIQRLRPVHITASAEGVLSRRGFAKSLMVCVHHGADEMLTQETLAQILAQPNVSFVVGDAMGVPQALLARADQQVKLSALPLSHTMEIAALIEQVLLSLEKQVEAAEQEAPVLMVPARQGAVVAATRSHRGSARREMLLSRYSTPRPTAVQREA